MRINVSEPKQCGCVTCVQHRTLGIFNTKETEPSNVIGSSFTSVPASSGPVQATGDSSALGSTSTSSPVQSSSSGTATPLDPPVTTSVDSEPAQPIDSTNVNWGVLNSKDAPANASASSNSSPVQSSSPAILNFRSAVTPVSSEPAQALGPTTSGSLSVSVFGSPPFGAPVTNIFGSTTSAASIPSIFGPMQASTFSSGASSASTSSTSSPFDSVSPLRWGSMQAPVQASALNTCRPFSFLPQQDSGKTASAYPSPFTGPPFGYNFLPAVQRPAAVYLGFNVATYPPSAATSLLGFYCPLMFGTPNLAALGTTTPAVQAYPMILGTPNLAAQGTTSPAVQLYPMILGTPNPAAQGTSTPAVHLYPMILGTPDLAAQGTTPAVQPYPMMFGSLNLAAQGTTPAVQPSPMMFGSLNLAAQGL